MAAEGCAQSNENESSTCTRRPTRTTAVSKSACVFSGRCLLILCRALRCQRSGADSHRVGDVGTQKCRGAARNRGGTESRRGGRESRTHACLRALVSYSVLLQWRQSSAPIAQGRLPVRSATGAQRGGVVVVLLLPPTFLTYKVGSWTHAVTLAARVETFAWLPVVDSSTAPEPRDARRRVTRGGTRGPKNT